MAVSGGKQPQEVSAGDMVASVGRSGEARVSLLSQLEELEAEWATDSVTSLKKPRYSHTCDTYTVDCIDLNSPASSAAPALPHSSPFQHRLHRSEPLWFLRTEAIVADHKSAEILRQEAFLAPPVADHTESGHDVWPIGLSIGLDEAVAGRDVLKAPSGDAAGSTTGSSRRVSKATGRDIEASAHCVRPAGCSIGPKMPSGSDDLKEVPLWVLMGSLRDAAGGTTGLRRVVKATEPVIEASGHVSVTMHPRDQPQHLYASQPSAAALLGDSMQRNLTADESGRLKQSPQEMQLLGEALGVQSGMHRLLPHSVPSLVARSAAARRVSLSASGAAPLLPTARTPFETCLVKGPSTSVQGIGDGTFPAPGSVITEVPGESSLISRSPKRSLLVPPSSKSSTVHILAGSRVITPRSAWAQTMVVNHIEGEREGQEVRSGRRASESLSLRGPCKTQATASRTPRARNQAACRDKVSMQANGKATAPACADAYAPGEAEVAYTCMDVVDVGEGSGKQIRKGQGRDANIHIAKAGSADDTDPNKGPENSIVLLGKRIDTLAS